MLTRNVIWRRIYISQIEREWYLRILTYTISRSSFHLAKEKCW